MTTILSELEQDLRKRAEEKYRMTEGRSLQVLSTVETKKLLHELQVHQIELEMQNDELHRAMAVVSEHKAHLENIIKMTPAGYFRIDLDGRFLEVNNAWLRMHGYDSSDEVVGRHFSIMQVDSGSDSALMHLAELQRGVPIPSGEFSSRRKDGSVGHHIFSAHPVVHVGKVVGFEWFIIDISERHKTEEALRRTRNMLARTEYITHTGSWEWEIATGAVSWSEELFRIHQLNPADGAPSLAEQAKLYHPEDMTELKRVVDIAFNKGTPYELELRAIRRDGATRNCLARGFAERDSEGMIVRLFGSLQDITESKLSDEKISEKEENLRFFFEYAPASLAMFDCNMCYLQVSQRWMNDYGLGSRNMIGLSHYEVFPEIPEQWKEAHQRGLAGEVLRKDDDRFVRDDGSVQWVNWELRPWYKGDGTIGGIVIFSEDITARKKSEEEKHTLELQFQQTQKLESLGVLAGGIAHDFNNILAIIMGYSGLTKMDSDTAEENMPHIEKAVERAAALCRQMLAYAGKAELAISPVNMRMVVDEMVTMLKATLPQNAEINTDLSIEIPFVNGDAGQIRQIIMNLITNASEAIGKEQGKIRVSLATTTVIAGQADRDYNGKSITPGEYVCLEVTDNGCGMDEETKWRIFEPFYTTKFPGRGLGMSAVLGIINSHDGALQLQSHPGQGTTIKVYLPVQKRVSAGDENIRVVVPSAPWRGIGTILLVEDEDQVRLIAKALLENIGFTVLEAVNGKEALELYQRNATDITLVMTDMGMPVMDGCELFYELKKLNPALPIIISSGYGDAEVSFRIGTDNIAGLVSKPYCADQLREVLKEVLKKALEGS